MTANFCFPMVPRGIFGQLKVKLLQCEHHVWQSESSGNQWGSARITRLRNPAAKYPAVSANCPLSQDFVGIKDMETQLFQESLSFQCFPRIVVPEFVRAISTTCSKLQSYAWGLFGGSNCYPHISSWATIRNSESLLRSHSCLLCATATTSLQYNFWL